MLHYMEPVSTNNKNNSIITYWKLTIALPNVKPLDFKVRSIKQLATILEMNETTLRKIIYDKHYHSKRYEEFLKYVTLTPQYT